MTLYVGQLSKYFQKVNKSTILIFVCDQCCFQLQFFFANNFDVISQENRNGLFIIQTRGRSPLVCHCSWAQNPESILPEKKSKSKSEYIYIYICIGGGCV